MKLGARWLALLGALLLVAAACGDSDTGTTDPPTTDTAVTPTTGGEEQPPPTEAEGEPFTFGMILVGPQNDRGWSQAHFEGGQYVEEQLGAEMLVVDKVNPADRPGVTPDQVARDMIDQGAQLIFFTSDDMKDGALLAAE